MSSHFFALFSRMKYIDRWSLMRNTDAESLSQHSLDVAAIAHALAVIGNKRLRNATIQEKLSLRECITICPKSSRVICLHP